MRFNSKIGSNLCFEFMSLAFSLIAVSSIGITFFCILRVHRTCCYEMIHILNIRGD